MTASGPRCRVCGENRPQRLRPGVIVRPAVADLIRRDVADWTDSSWICLDDLARYRHLYVESLLSTEKGEIDELQNEVLRSLREQAVLTRNPEEEFRAELSAGERLADRIAALGGSWTAPASRGSSSKLACGASRRFVLAAPGSVSRPCGASCATSEASFISRTADRAAPRSFCRSRARRIVPDALLVIEDEPLLRTELERHFRRQGWEVATSQALDSAKRLLREREIEPLVVLTDMSLPDGNALDLLEESRERRLLGEWVFLTGYGSVPDSVRALRLGAFDFLEKPCELERLDMVVAGAARSARAQRRLREQATAQSLKYSPSSFAGTSPAARHVRDMLQKLADVPFSALVITGETGTGKGLAARILHHAGRRSEGPLVEVNCAAFPRDLLESELFGHEAGAFTGARGLHRGLLEKADQGTLFLDEVSEMPLELQVKLLKAIEDRSFRRIGEREIRVDVTVIAATNRDIEARVHQGSFRGDLYHRLSVFRLEVPPLRVRKEDLKTLVPTFIAEFDAIAGKSVRVVSEETWKLLERHDWPGNVRELRNAVERSVLFAQTELFPDEWLQLRAEKPELAPRVEGNWLTLPLDGSMPLDAMDRYIIKTALERNEHNVTRAARALGTTRETLRYRIQKYGLIRS